MENLVLFVVTTITYTIAVASLLAWNDMREIGGSFWEEMRRIFVDEYKDVLRALGMFTLLCLPLNINGNVFTVLGNVHSTGVKNAYSVFSLYQNAEYNAYSLFGALYQKADKGDAVTIVGLFPNQIAGNNAAVVIGVTPFQRADKNAGTGLGVSLYQKAGNNARVILGINGWQYGRSSYVDGGISVYQKSKEKSSLFLGLTVVQNSEKLSMNGPAMSVYQRAGNQSRAFAVWSTLQAK